MTQVYKVVYEEADGRLTSVATGGELEVEYVPRRWAEAPVGGLLVFTNYEAALQFGAGQVWQADAEDPVPLPPRGLVCPTEKQAELIWEGRTTGALEWPEGTTAFRRVRIHTRIT
jgi:hypothetical protein